MPNFAAKIRYCLTDANLSYQELADRSGIPEHEIQAILDYNDPRRSELECLAAALDMAPAFFLTTSTGEFNQLAPLNERTGKARQGATQAMAAKLQHCQARCAELEKQLALTQALVPPQEVVIAAQHAPISLLDSEPN